MEKQIVAQGKSLNYSIGGSGPVVVLLHGFLESLGIWAHLAMSLQKDFTVVCIDLPGFGKSEVIEEIHSMPLMAKAVNRVFEEENIEDCVLIGHSMGGYAALAFAKQYPDKLKGLVLFHSQAAADDEEGKQNRDRTIEVVKNNHKDFIGAFIPLLFAEENVHRFETEITQLKQLSAQTSVDGICAALAGMRDRDDHLPLLKSIDVPVFFVVGKQDSRIAMEKILPQLALPKNCEALILDKVGHMGFIEAKEITTKAIRHFAERMNEEYFEEA
jgi:pimeloyl-ACP methyl ester carboxylesterase